MGPLGVFQNREDSQPLCLANILYSDLVGYTSLWRKIRYDDMTLIRHGKGIQCKTTQVYPKHWSVGKAYKNWQELSSLFSCWCFFRDCCGEYLTNKNTYLINNMDSNKKWNMYMYTYIYMIVWMYNKRKNTLGIARTCKTTTDIHTWQSLNHAGLSNIEQHVDSGGQDLRGPWLQGDQAFKEA